jgi:hypothetical protein
VIERGVHVWLTSILLIWRITSFRLIEQLFNPIVKSIESAMHRNTPWRRNLNMERSMRNKAEIWGGQAPQTRKESVMSILSAIGRLAAEYSEARARYLTERSIHSLPIELQKDIGWPDAYENRNSRRFVGGH